MGPRALNVGRGRDITYQGGRDRFGARTERATGGRMSVLVDSKTTPITRVASRPAPELTVVVPTFNERANVPLLVAPGGYSTYRGS